MAGKPHSGGQHHREEAGTLRALHRPGQAVPQEYVDEASQDRQEC